MFLVVFSLLVFYLFLILILLLRVKNNDNSDEVISSSRHNNFGIFLNLNFIFYIYEKINLSTYTIQNPGISYMVNNDQFAGSFAINSEKIFNRNKN